MKNTLIFIILSATIMFIGYANIPAGHKGVSFNSIHGNYGVCSKDGMTIYLDISIYYRVNPDKEKMQALYGAFRSDYVDSLLVPKCREGIRDVAAGYTSNEIIATKRSEYGSDILANLQESLQPEGIDILTIALRAVDPPQEVQDAISRSKGDDSKVAPPGESGVYKLWRKR